MDTLVFLLRGINVGGSGRLPMASLRSIAEGLGMTEVRTYIQSGNLVASWDRTADDAAEALRTAIDETAGFAPAVLVRTAAELRAVVGANPFARAGVDPKELHVTFLDADAVPALASTDLEGFAPEGAAAVGREVYLHLPGGIGRSPLATALSRRAPTGEGTTRGWRTVTTLASMTAGER